MTSPKSLTYDEHKAAEAAFRGFPPDPEWTDAAKAIYVQLSAAIVLRGTGPLNIESNQDLEAVSR
jgi:hypothetical protein